VLETEDLLEEMEALAESTEREKDGRYIAVAIVFGVGRRLLFVCMCCGDWMEAERLEVEECLVDGMFGFEDC
jgi:hypothetical protein